MKHKTKLKLKIANKSTGKYAEVHFPVITPTRRKHLDSLGLSEDNYIITSSDFHIPQVNNAILKKSANLEEINYFALLYFYEMEQNGRDTIDLLIKSGYVNIDSTHDILEVLNHLDNYYIINGASTPGKVALSYIELAKKFGCQLDENFTEKQLEFTGKKIVESEKGIFYKCNYIALYPVTKQKEKPPVEIPDCVKLFK